MRAFIDKAAQPVARPPDDHVEARIGGVADEGKAARRVFGQRVERTQCALFIGPIIGPGFICRDFRHWGSDRPACRHRSILSPLPVALTAANY